MRSRRSFLRSGALVAAAGVAGCTGRGAGDGPLRIAFQAPAETVDINTWHGVTEYTDVETDVTVFEGVDLAVQSVLSGEADIARGSVTAAATLAETEEPFRFVAAPVRSTDYVLVTRSGIDSLEAIVEQDATIGMSAPTGLDAVQVAAVMLEAGVIDSADELNYQRVGYSGARRSAVIEGEIDVSPQHYAQWRSMREEADLNNLLAFGDRLDSWIQETFMLPPRTLEQRPDAVQSFLEGQLRANRALYGDYELYQSVVERHVDGAPPASVLEPTYEFVTGIDIWPRNGGLTRDRVDYMLDLTDRLGVTEERVPTDEILERGPLDDALEAVGRA